MRSASAKRDGLTEDDIDEGIENYEESDKFSPAEKAALRYSDLMATAVYSEPSGLGTVGCEPPTSGVSFVA